MVFLVLGENEDIIQINKNKMVKHIAKNIIKALKNCRSICEPKGHDQIDIHSGHWEY